jgi:hypothetical protein
MKYSSFNPKPRDDNIVPNTVYLRKKTKDNVKHKIFIYRSTYYYKYL